MATAKATAIQKPLIQIDDEIREMTDEEHEAYLEQQANAPAPLVSAE
jgi:hypothetical protein